MIDRVQPTTFESLADRARALTSSGRRVLGITGPPGAGKSWLASRIVEALGGRAVLVAMDGFHLDDVVLRTLGRRDRKGAPDTFDVGGYVALLRRLRGGGARWSTHRRSTARSRPRAPLPSPCRRTCRSS